MILTSIVNCFPLVSEGKTSKLNQMREEYDGNAEQNEQPLIFVRIFVFVFVMVKILTHYVGCGSLLL